MTKQEFLDSLKNPETKENTLEAMAQTFSDNLEDYEDMESVLKGLYREGVAKPINTMNDEELFEEAECIGFIEIEDEELTPEETQELKDIIKKQNEEQA